MMKIAKRVYAGHAVYEREFPEKASLREIKNAIDDEMLNVYDRYETDSGTPSNLKLYNQVFDSRKEAQRFLDPIANNYQDCAVRFKEYQLTPKAQERFKQAEEKEKQALKEVIEKEINTLLKKMAKCNNCKSSINLNYYNPPLKVNNFVRYEDGRINVYDMYCPICRGVLVAFKELPKVKKALAKLDELQNNKQRKLKQGKFIIKWLARADRHV